MLSDSILVRAVQSFSKRLVVVSPELKVLADFSRRPPVGETSVVGRICHELYYHKETPCHDCAVAEAAASGRPTIRMISQFDDRSPMGRERYFFPILNGESVEAVAVVDFDADSFAWIEAELSGSNSFLKSLIMSSVDGIIASDMKGRMLIFNEAAADITGYSSRRAMSDLNIRDLYPGEGARTVMHQLRSDEGGGKGKLRNFSVELKRKDGSIVPIDLSASIVYDRGREAATVGFFYDLTEKLAMEKELREAQVQLLQAEKMSSLGRLAAGVAHQLNNPLGGIVLFTELLMENYDLEPPIIKDLQRILEDAERCHRIVLELLDFTRQSGLEIKENDVNRAIDRAVFLLEGQPQFKHIEFIRHYSEKLPPIPSDIQQLGHVFMNMILNAADAIDGRGRIEITTRGAPERNVVEIRIADDGPGMPEEVLKHVFEPFYTTKEKGSGTGLGLSIAYGIIVKHGGSLTVQNRPQGGAEFLIELPMTRGE